jgi:hypothetical protein
LSFACLSISKLFVGSIPGPTLFLGALAAGFEGAWAGKWLWRRDRMAMLVGGGGMVDVSAPEAVGAPLGFLAVDWLKRRTKELLRVGRVSVGVPVKDGMLLLLPEAVLSAGTPVLNVPGAGKSLRAGSYERLLAKSSKLTVGRKS